MRTGVGKMEALSMTGGRFLLPGQVVKVRRGGKGYSFQKMGETNS